MGSGTGRSHKNPGTLSLLLHGLGSDGSVAHHLDAAGVLLAACTSFPLIAWRRAPLAVFAVTTAASAALMARGYPSGPPLGPTVALYLLAASRDAARPWTRRITIFVIAAFCLHVTAFGIGHGQVPEIQLAVGALVWALAWFAGERTRLRRQQLDEFEHRAIRAEHEAMQERRLAVAEERARIARDLHDSAAHAINVIAIQAGAARLWQEQDPARSRTAQIELSYGERTLELTVSNAVRPDAPTRVSSGGGHGLVGMCERAALLGGELEAGRRNRSFRVHARLPYGDAP